MLNAIVTRLVKLQHDDGGLHGEDALLSILCRCRHSSVQKISSEARLRSSAVRTHGEAEDHLNIRR